MSVKLYRRSVVVKNLLVFTVLSYFYFHSLVAISSGVSCFNLAGFLYFLKSKWLVLFLMILSVVTVFYAQKFSKYILFGYLFSIVYGGSKVFWGNFDKTILLLDFFFILIASCFYIIWSIELGGVLYRPGYSIHDIGRKSLYPLRAFLEIEGFEIVTGYLSNWDRNGCFIVLEEQLLTNKLSAELRARVRVDFEGHSFSAFGRIFSSYGAGVGLLFSEEEAPSATLLEHGWTDFYSILKDRGIVLQR